MNTPPKLTNYVDASPKMLEPVFGRKNQKSRIPFDDMPVNKSIIIPFDEGVESTLRVMVCNANKTMHPKRFRCIKHQDHKVYEIGRLEDTAEPAKVEVVTTLAWGEQSPLMGGNSDEPQS